MFINYQNPIYSRLLASHEWSSSTTFVFLNKKEKIIETFAPNFGNLKCGSYSSDMVSNEKI